MDLLKHIIKETIMEALQCSLQETRNALETELTLETEKVFPELSDIEAAEELDYDFSVTIKYEKTPAEPATYDYPGFAATFTPLSVTLDREFAEQVSTMLNKTVDEIKLTIIDYIDENELLSELEDSDDFVPDPDDYYEERRLRNL